MKRQAVLAWRMRRRHLTERAPAAAALDVVTAICGLHAQVMSSAEAMLQARADVPDGYVERALWEHGTLTKTWAMRGTLHLLPTGELPLWTGAQAALKPRTSNPTWLRHFNLTPEQAQAILDEVPATLENGGPLTREALATWFGMSSAPQAGAGSSSSMPWRSTSRGAASACEAKPVMSEARQ